ncbi:MAG: 1-acyl-sn-glycerol-3-phosphate acyltransferase [Bacteroidales bacterium]|nr:1-acyl-sn-glycerol-3-phosphate acyltransferase [Bacteroidales bacterium]
MEQNYDFEEIRCYNDSEVPEKLWTLVDRPEIEAFVKGAFPDINMPQLRSQIKKINTINDFQSAVISRFVFDMIKKTCASFEVYGAENVDRNGASLFITNHRDIVFDPAIICGALFKNQLKTAEVAIGDNLFAYDWIEELVRLNKCFVVKRNVPIRQMLEVSKRLSGYIHYTIKEKNNPIWIAQREGRSKDSKDDTQASVIKMLALGGPSRDIIQNIRQLNMQPTTLIYEYDPCDYLKAAEFQLKRDNPEWKKTKQDDVVSMSTGLVGFKGRVAVVFGKPLNPIFDTYPWIDDRNAQVNCICNLVDKTIHSNYKLFPINYAAYDIKYDTDKYASKYTVEEKAKVMEYLNAQLAKIQIPNRDDAFLWDKLLTMYSNPVVNKEKAF